MTSSHTRDNRGAFWHCFGQSLENVLMSNLYIFHLFFQCKCHRTWQGTNISDMNQDVVADKIHVASDYFFWYLEGCEFLLVRTFGLWPKWDFDAYDVPWSALWWVYDFLPFCGLCQHSNIDQCSHFVQVLCEECFLLLGEYRKCSYLLLIRLQTVSNKLHFWAASKRLEKCRYWPPLVDFLLRWHRVRWVGAQTFR